MTVVRFPDWPQRLARAINAHRATPYAWGAFDCMLAAASLVEAETGRDFGAAFRGTYADEAGAQKMLDAHGWPDIAAAISHFLPARAERPRRGDVVLRAGRHGPFSAIVWQGGVIGPGPAGLILWPAHDILGCWSVG